MTAPQDPRAEIEAALKHVQAAINAGGEPLPADKEAQDHARFEWSFLVNGALQKSDDALHAALTRLDHLERERERLERIKEAVKGALQKSDDALHAALTRLDHLERERERFVRIEECASKLLALTEWMTGSSDFGAGGRAYDGWNNMLGNMILEDMHVAMQAASSPGGGGA